MLRRFSVQQRVRLQDPRVRGYEDQCGDRPQAAADGDPELDVAGKPTPLMPRATSQQKRQDGALKYEIKRRCSPPKSDDSPLNPGTAP